MMYREFWAQVNTYHENKFLNEMILVGGQIMTHAKIKNKYMS